MVVKNVCGEEQPGACRPPLAVVLVKGHAKDIDVARGRTTSEDKFGNDGADKLAVAGAATHRILSEVVVAAAERRHIAMQTHKMMLAILIARQSQENNGDDADRGSDMGDCMELDCTELLDDDFDHWDDILSDVT